MTPEAQFGRTDLSTASATAPAGGSERFEVDPTLDGLSLGRVFLAEGLKLLSLRSTWWLSAGAVLLCGLFALLAADSVSWLAEARHEALATGAEEEAAGYALQAVLTAMFGMLFAVILLGALGVLTITGEHTTGALRSSLTAVPRRSLLWASKAAIVGLWAAAVGLLCAVVVHLVLLPFGLAHNMVPSLADPEVLRLYGAGVLCAVVAGLIGFGVGSLLRSSAGGIVVFSTVVFVLPVLVTMFVGTVFGGTPLETLWEVQVLPLMLALGDPAAGGPTPSLAAVGLLLWTVAALLPGWLLFRVRDV